MIHPTDPSAPTYESHTFVLLCASRQGDTVIRNTDEHSVVATYGSHTSAEAAVKVLQQAGLDMKCLSIVGRDEHALAFYTTGDQIKVWGGRGAFWGSLWGMLFGGAFLFLPALGPLVVMGPMVGWIIGALEAAPLSGTEGAVAAALTSIGIPVQNVTQYDLEVKRGSFLVIARGGAVMLEHAHNVLKTTGPSNLAVHVAVPEPDATIESQTAAATREGVLKLLSDGEVAHVSSAEAGVRLADGDEYLDLEQLGRGVQKAAGASTAMGHVLPRRAVAENTWLRILSRLPTVPPRAA